jgi:hypothetical protein
MLNRDIRRQEDEAAGIVRKPRPVGLLLSK